MLIEITDKVREVCRNKLGIYYDKNSVKSNPLELLKEMEDVIVSLVERIEEFATSDPNTKPGEIPPFLKEAITKQKQAYS